MVHGGSPIGTFWYLQGARDVTTGWLGLCYRRIYWDFHTHVAYGR